MYTKRLKYNDKTDPFGATQNDDGHYVDVAPQVRLVEVPCRYSVNSQGRLIPSQDGSSIVYSFVVSMPKDTEHIPQGTTVSIYDEAGELRQSGTVKLFHRGLMDAKAWV